MARFADPWRTFAPWATFPPAVAVSRHPSTPDAPRSPVRIDLHRSATRVMNGDAMKNTQRDERNKSRSLRAAFAARDRAAATTGIRDSDPPRTDSESRR